MKKLFSTSSIIAAMLGLAASASGAATAFGSFGLAMSSGRGPTPKRRVSGASYNGADRTRDRNGVIKGMPGSKLARKAAKGSVGLYSGRRGIIADAR